MTQDQEIKMFGETITQMRLAAKYNLGDPMLLNIYVNSILSDAQERLNSGHTLRANQYINKAKYFISEATALKSATEKLAISSGQGLKELVVLIGRERFNTEYARNDIDESPKQKG